MALTKTKTFSRIPKEIQNPNNSGIHPSKDVYAIYLDDNSAALVQSLDDFGAVILNYIADQSSLERWELDANYFDEFINENVWEAFVFEMEKDKAKDAETQTVGNSAIVLNGLNVSHSLDTINAGHVLLGVLASSLLAEETLSNFGKAGNFGLAAYNLDRTDSTFENNGATIESRGTSEAEGSTSTLGTGEAYC